jgi:hypothetical protein
MSQEIYHLYERKDKESTRVCYISQAQPKDLKEPIEKCFKQNLGADVNLIFSGTQADCTLKMREHLYPEAKEKKK